MLSMLWLGLTLIALGAEPSREINVAIVVGDFRLPLGVQYHFADVQGKLPPPGYLPVDAHDREHGAETYCYGYRAPNGSFRLEFFDSDFGMHTARLSRIDADSSTCSALTSEPRFVVAEKEYSMTSENWSAPLNFVSEDKGDSKKFQSQWKVTDPSRPHKGGTCFSRSVYIEIKHDRNGTKSITVQNWEEPGC